MPGLIITVSPGLTVVDVRADRVDDAHAVGAEDPRRDQLSCRAALHRPEVDVVERSRTQSHANVIRGGDLRLGEIVAKSQLFQATVRVDREGSHHFLLLLFTDANQSVARDALRPTPSTE